MQELFKFPRTFHLPDSPGVSSDDKTLSCVDHFVGKEVVVTEKMDGENCSMYPDYIHARSLDSKHHESRSWVKQLHGMISKDIPDNFRVCGENIFAKHSIYYRCLQTYFLVFGIYNRNLCLSWDETVEYAVMLGLKTVSVLYRGVWDAERVRACWTGQSITSPGDEQEGYVVRLAEAFSHENHAESTAKFVRAGHITTSQHWMSEKVVPNLLYNHEFDGKISH